MVDQTYFRVCAKSEKNWGCGGMLSSSLMVRRFCSFSAAASSPPLTPHKKRLVFLGSPQVSASVIDALFCASSAADSLFESEEVINSVPLSGNVRALCKKYKVQLISTNLA